MGRIAEVGDRPLPEAIRGVVASVFDLYVRNFALVRALRSVTGLVAAQVGGRPAEQMLIEVMRQRIRERAGELLLEDPELSAFVVFHLVESLCARLVEFRRPRWDDDRCIDEITTVVLRYGGVK
jgi:hypothetical protein